MHTRQKNEDAPSSSLLDRLIAKSWAGRPADLALPLGDADRGGDSTWGPAALPCVWYIVSAARAAACRTARAAPRHSALCHAACLCERGMVGFRVMLSPNTIVLPPTSDRLLRTENRKDAHLRAATRDGLYGQLDGRIFYGDFN